MLAEGYASKHQRLLKKVLGPWNPPVHFFQLHQTPKEATEGPPRAEGALGARAEA